MCHVDGQVAHDADLAGTAVLAQVAPLPEEEELEVAVRGDDGRQPLAPRGKRLRVARPRARLPAAPDDLAVVLLERHKEREILQPPGIGLAEGGKRGVAGTGEEAAGNPFQHTRLPWNHSGEIYLVFRQERRRRHVQWIERDQQRIAGQRGKALVRRIAVAGGPEREHLPKSLAGIGEKIGKAPRGFAQVADTPRPRKRSGMKQDTAGTREAHGSDFSVLHAAGSR